MQIDLTGKRALVTGATFSETNSGYVIAKTLAQSGASVVMNGRTAERVDNALSALKAEVPEADLTAAPADLSSAAGVGKLIALAPNVDIFVHNAGLPEVKSFFDLNEADWDLH